MLLSSGGRTWDTALYTVRGVVSGSRDVDSWCSNGCTPSIGVSKVPMSLEHDPVTSSDKSAPGPDPRISHRIQIVMFRSIRVDHTNFLQLSIKAHSSTKSQGRWTRSVTRTLTMTNSRMIGWTLYSHPPSGIPQKVVAVFLYVLFLFTSTSRLLLIIYFSLHQPLVLLIKINKVTVFGQNRWTPPPVRGGNTPTGTGRRVFPTSQPVQEIRDPCW